MPSLVDPEEEGLVELGLNFRTMLRIRLQIRKLFFLQYIVKYLPILLHKNLERAFMKDKHWEILYHKTVKQRETTNEIIFQKFSGIGFSDP